jgi:hypothetical protein
MVSLLEKFSQVVKGIMVKCTNLGVGSQQRLIGFFIFEGKAAGLPLEKKARLFRGNSPASGPVVSAPEDPDFRPLGVREKAGSGRKVQLGQGSLRGPSCL